MRFHFINISVIQRYHIYFSIFFSLFLISSYAKNEYSKYDDYLVFIIFIDIFGIK